MVIECKDLYISIQRQSSATGQCNSTFVFEIQGIPHFMILIFVVPPYFILDLEDHFIYCYFFLEHILSQNCPWKYRSTSRLIDLYIILWCQISMCQ